MSRETVVFLPGMMCDARLFQPQIDALSDRYDCVTPVLPLRDTMTGLASDLLAQLPGRFNLVGLSMGGIIAMEMLRQAPERVKRLALLDTNHRADLPERIAIRNRQIADVEAGHLRAVIVDEMKPNYLAERNQNDQAMLDGLITMAMDVGADAFVAQSKALRDRADQTGALQAFTGPALVLCGAEDRLCQPSRHQEIAALLPDADLVILSATGHIATLESPDAVTGALQDWLARSTG